MVSNRIRKSVALVPGVQFLPPIDRTTFQQNVTKTHTNNKKSVRNVEILINMEEYGNRKSLSYAVLFTRVESSTQNHDSGYVKAVKGIYPFYLVRQNQDKQRLNNGGGWKEKPCCGVK